ncbi:hypothetical protein GGI05_003013 [Coemansia sp. RSA 2603]|nr:hypothetical protein GGI05_003013 [Coemansia sp. RSA 2603]
MCCTCPGPECHPVRCAKFAAAAAEARVAAATPGATAAPPNPSAATDAPPTPVDRPTAAAASAAMPVAAAVPAATPVAAAVPAATPVAAAVPAAAPTEAAMPSATPAAPVVAPAVVDAPAAVSPTPSLRRSALGFTQASPELAPMPQAGPSRSSRHHEPSTPRVAPYDAPTKRVTRQSSRSSLPTPDWPAFQPLPAPALTPCVRVKATVSKITLLYPVAWPLMAPTTSVIPGSLASANTAVETVSSSAAFALACMSIPVQVPVLNPKPWSLITFLATMFLCENYVPWNTLS